MRTIQFAQSSKSSLLATVAGATLALATPAQALTLSDVYTSFNGYAIGNFGTQANPYGSVDSLGGMGVGGNVWSQMTFNANNIHAIGLSVGGHFNAVGGHNIHGNLEVEGNVTLNNPHVFGSVKTNGNFTASQGTVDGTVQAAGTYSPGTMNVVGGGSGGNPPFVPTYDHSEIASLLTSGSSGYAGLSNTGAVFDNGFGSLTFTTISGQSNVFTVDASLINSANTFTFNGDATADVIVNVTGGAVTMQNAGFNFNGGLGASRILFNLFQATSLTVQQIGVKASVLAPLASVNFTNGHIDGGFFAQSFVGNGQFHHFAFSGMTPGGGTAVPEPGTLGLLAAGGLLGGAIRRRRAAAAA